jgi:flagellar FliL protein
VVKLFIDGVNMAKGKNDLNLGNGDKTTEKQQGEKGGMKKIIIIVVALLLVGGGAAAFFLLGGDSADATTDEATAEAEAVVEEKDPIYHELVRDFVITFDDPSGTRYLQLSLQVMAYEQEIIDKVNANLPAVRNSLIMLVGGQNFEDLKTNEGKENLRKQILDSVQSVSRLKAGQKLEDVLFTGFVLQ